MNKKINEKTSSFENLIDQINETAGPIQRERGTLFEKLVIAYLKNEPMYKNLFTDVWLLNEVPNYYSIPKKDTGVDIVARHTELMLISAATIFMTAGALTAREIYAKN